jgi:hypothetical protein
MCVSFLQNALANYSHESARILYAGYSSLSRVYQLQPLLWRLQIPTFWTLINSYHVSPRASWPTWRINQKVRSYRHWMTWRLMILRFIVHPTWTLAYESFGRKTRKRQSLKAHQRYPLNFIMTRHPKSHSLGLNCFPLASTMLLILRLFYFLRKPTMSCRPAGNTPQHYFVSFTCIRALTPLIVRRTYHHFLFPCTLFYWRRLNPRMPLTWRRTHFGCLRP